MPTSLLGFWETEIRTWLGSNVDILTYEKNLQHHGMFFSSSDTFSESKMPPYRRVILVTSTVGYSFSYLQVSEN